MSLRLGQSGAALMPRSVIAFRVEVMRITGKGRTWHQEGDDWLSHDAAMRAADRLRRQGFTARTRPVLVFA